MPNRHDPAASLRKKYPGFCKKYGLETAAAAARRRFWQRLGASIRQLAGLFLSFAALWVVLTYSIYDRERPLNPGHAPSLVLPADTRMRLDARVAEAERLGFKDHAALARYLTEPFTEDHARIYAIYRWITSNISYDVGLARSKDIPYAAVEPEFVYEQKRTVCSGYAALLQSMAQTVGLEVRVVEGNGSGGELGARPVSRRNREFSDHAWNMVRLNGFWYPLDATWDAGGVLEGSDLFEWNTGAFDYFLSEPARFREDHDAARPNENLLGSVQRSNFSKMWWRWLGGRPLLPLLTR